MRGLKKHAVLNVKKEKVIEMSITIRARGIEGHLWRLSIEDEVWEMNTTEELLAVLNQLVMLKDKFGRIDKRGD